MYRYNVKSFFVFLDKFEDIYRGKGIKMRLKGVKKPNVEENIHVEVLKFNVYVI